MADPLSRCPAAVRDRDPFVSVDLEASVPYKSVRDVSVAVPPFDVPSPFLTGLTDPSRALTGTAGQRIGNGNEVGWAGSQEREQASKLRELAASIIARGREFHPDARADVLNLARGAVEDLDRIDAIYAKWEDSYLGVRKERQSYVGGYLRQGDHAAEYGQMAAPGLQLSLSLTLQTPFEFISANGLGPEVIDQKEGTTNAALFYDSYKGVLLMPGESYPPGTYIDPRAFMPLMLDARRRDRDRIRNLWIRVYRQLWCAEYGVAQSESYNANKEIYDESSTGRGLAGAPPKTGPLEMKLVLGGDDGGGFDWDVGSGDTGAPPPESGEEPGASEEAIVEDQETGVVEAEDAEALPDTGKTKWYKTTGGKVALGVGAVVFGGAAVVGVAKLIRRPAPPRY